MKAEVKILRTVAIYCQKSGCGKTATHLFRMGRDPAFIGCEFHAAEEAQLLGIELPEDTTKALQAGR